MWVLDWLEMDFLFHPNLVGLVNETNTRMRTTVVLVNGEHNDLKDDLEEQVNSTWDAINNGS